MRSRALLPLGFLVLLLSAPAQSQYLYLDTNGNGIHDAADRLAPSGPTSIDIWLVSDRNRDGTQVECDVTDAYKGLTVNSYTVVLHVAGGDVKWGPMRNRLPFRDPEFTPVCFATYEDTTDTQWYHNGWGSIDQFPPGRYLLATLQVTVMAGTPSLFVEPNVPLRPVKITQFGTSCMALEGDNTYKLGLDWNDVDGLGPMRADAGGPYEVQAGRALPVDASGTRFPISGPLSFAWDFGDGATAGGVTATHVYAEAGDYRLILTATSAAASDADSTTVHVLSPNAPNAPLARFISPPTGHVGVAVTFDASASYDPDGDPITYSWDFGDGTTAGGAVVQHAYPSGGAFMVTLTVSDWSLVDELSRQITIYAVSNPPVAAVGGPYTGIMGGLVTFDGTASSDPDGDALQFLWGFGDRTSALGAVAAHRYEAPGSYSVRLTVSDGGLSSTAMTSATITESLPARAFLNGPPVYVRGQDTPLTVRVEPVEGAFRLRDVDPWPIDLRSPLTGSVEQIASVEDARIVPDSDGNGIAELSFTFSPEELALLFANAEPSTVAATTVRGSFFGGGFFTADLSIPVGAPDAVLRPLRIAPNPFNPEAVVTFSTRSAGSVSAHLFDVHGRLVRTLLDHVALGAGPHALTLDARDQGGTILASGVYFFRLSGPDGVTTRRVAIAK